MWGGQQDSMDQHGLWGTPGHSQSSWSNGSTGHSMPYPPRPPQWPNQMQQQWGYQHPQQAAQWHMPPQQQMGWSNSPNQGYVGYEEKKVPGNRGYSGYGYGGMQQQQQPQQQSMAQQQPWHGQRDVYQRQQQQPQQQQQWDNSMRQNNSGWTGSSSSSSQWHNEWQGESGGTESPGLNQPGFDTWPGVGGGIVEEGNIMWRDPKPKKKVRDTGVQLWGDPTTQMDKILRWKEADHEEFQKGPSTSTWNQLHFPEDSIRGFSKANFANPISGDINDPTVYALHNAFQRALTSGLLPMDMKKHPLDSKLKEMVNTLLQKMVKEEQAEAELEHIRQIMARGDYPVTVAQEHERIENEREGFKTEITILSDEIKNAAQGGSWLQQWQKRNTSVSEPADGLTDALRSMGISEETPKIPNPAPWADEASLTWNEPPPISVNTDLDRPTKLEDNGSGDRKTTGPQEFIPGKKWEWNDPAKVAEDPHATPGSVKPSFASPSWGNGNCDPWTEKPEKKSSTEESPEI